MWIFENSIVTLDNFRCPLKSMLSIKEINAMQSFNSNNLYSYLMQLKINKFNDYGKVKEMFEKLSNGKDFDIRIKEIKDSSKNTNIPPLAIPSSLLLEAQINQNQNSVEVSIIDHKLELELYFRDGQDSEEYPFEFSPAGYYEMLTLSAITAGNNDKVIILDEPAQNLHPTFQHKLLLALLEIDKHNKDNKDNNNQFFIITHSPDLVKIDKESIKNIFIFRRKDKATFINKFEPDNFDKIKLFKYEELKRLFFAKGVVLVEGFSEEILMNRLIRNPTFFEKVIKNALNDKDSKNIVNLGDIEVVNIEGVNGLMGFICLAQRLNLHYVAVIDDDIFNSNPKIEELKNNYHVHFVSPNFEGYVDKDFKDFKENYLDWCKEKFGSSDSKSECEKYKKVNYPLYLTENEDILSEIINGNKLKVYSDAFGCLIKQINDLDYNVLCEK